MTANVQGNKSKHKRLVTMIKQDKTKCKFSAINVAFDTATYERKNRCKTTDMSRTYLDATGAESGLESPPLILANVEYMTYTCKRLKTNAF